MTGVQTCALPISVIKYICDNSLLEISNTIEINCNNCKQFSIVKIHKDKTNYDKVTQKVISKGTSP